MSKPKRICPECGEKCYGVHTCRACYSKRKGRSNSKRRSERRVQRRYQQQHLKDNQI